MKNKRQTGSIYEKQTEEYLISLGWKILARNYRTRFGEIDLIARDGRYIVFVEVKYRSSARRGQAAEAVDDRKQRQIIGCSLHYLAYGRMRADQPVRYDVACVGSEGITLIKNAFQFGEL